MTSMQTKGIVYTPTQLGKNLLIEIKTTQTNKYSLDEINFYSNRDKSYEWCSNGACSCSTVEFGIIEHWHHSLINPGILVVTLLENLGVHLQFLDFLIIQIAHYIQYQNTASSMPKWL